MDQIKNLTLSLLMTLTAVTIVCAQQQPIKLEDPEWIREIAPKRIVYSVPSE